MKDKLSTSCKEIRRQRLCLQLRLQQCPLTTNTDLNYKWNYTYKNCSKQRNIFFSLSGFLCDSFNQLQCFEQSQSLTAAQTLMEAVNFKWHLQDCRSLGFPLNSVLPIAKFIPGCIRILHTYHLIEKYALSDNILVIDIRKQ